MKPDFPLVWDNSMRSAFVACPRKFSFEYLDHWKPRSPRVDPHAGKAWAEGMEKARVAFYLDKLSPEESMRVGLEAMLAAYGDFECPEDSPKSASRLAEAYVYYFTHFPLDRDPATPYLGPNGPMIEFSFVLPLDEGLIHPVTGDPILYSGRADMVANYAGAVTIYDDKTTKQLGATWASQWDLRAQFTGYAWAAGEYGIPAQQVLVRGIAIRKTGFDKAQAISHRPEWRIESWRQQVVRDIRRAMALWEEGYWDFVESDACSNFGGCLFRQVCQSREHGPWLETNFIRRKWDPVTRTETVL